MFKNDAGGRRRLERLMIRESSSCKRGREGREELLLKWNQHHDCCMS
jgi:hypothetical protein